MKARLSISRKIRAFTLAELSVAMGISVTVGLLLGVTTVAGLRLYAKGSSINMGHQEVRSAFERVCRDVRAAVTIPALVNPARQMLDNTADAPGIAFSLPASPVLRVAANAAAGQRVIEIVTGSYVPVPGQRLLVPTHNLESDIESVAGGSNASQKSITLKTNLPLQITTNSSGTDYNINAYVVDLASYIVVGNELRFYPNILSDNYTVVTRRMLNPTPFRIPSNTGGGSGFTTDDDRFVLVRFGASDPTYSNLGFQRTAFQMNALVAHNALLGVYRGFYEGSNRGPQGGSSSAPPVSSASPTPPTSTQVTSQGNGQ